MLHSSSLLFFVFFLLPSFLSPSFHPSLPHIHDPVINLVEISRSLINACPPSSPPPHLFSSRRLFLFRLYRILGFYFFSSSVFLSVAFFSVFLADENEVMCSARGVREEDWVALPPLDSLGDLFSNSDSDGLTTEYDALNSRLNS